MASQATPKTEQLQQALAASVLNPGGNNDYVQCEFTTAELFDLRLLDSAGATLTDLDSEALKARIIAKALSPQYSDQYNQGATAKFISMISGTSFAGRTQSEALVMVMTDFQVAQKSPQANQVRIDFTLKRLPSSVQEQARNVLSPLSTSSNTGGEDFAEQIKSPDLSSTATPEQKSAVESAVTAVSTAATAGTDKANDQLADVVDTTRQVTTAFLRPPDVGCAMSLLDYNETKVASETWWRSNTWRFRWSSEI